MLMSCGLEDTVDIDFFAPRRKSGLRRRAIFSQGNKKGINDDPVEGTRRKLSLRLEGNGAPRLRRSLRRKAVMWDLERTGEELERTAVERTCQWRAIFDRRECGRVLSSEQLVMAVEQRFGRIDICVTNAGGHRQRNCRNHLEEWPRPRSTLPMLSTVYFAREVLPRMQQKRWGLHGRHCRIREAAN